MSGIKRSRPDDVPSTEIQAKRTTVSTSSDHQSKFSGKVEEEYDW